MPSHTASLLFLSLSSFPHLFPFPFPSFLPSLVPFVLSCFFRCCLCALLFFPPVVPSLKFPFCSLFPSLAARSLGASLSSSYGFTLLRYHPARGAPVG